MSIKLKIEGFEELMKAIEDAGGSVQQAAESTIKQSAKTMDDELKTQMRSAGVPQDLIAEMDKPEIESTPTRVSASVGYKKGAYNPDNPSAGYKAVFLNYGTPNRSKHGKVKALGFIQKAKRKAKPKIKKQQEECLNKILSRLKK